MSSQYDIPLNASGAELAKTVHCTRAARETLHGDLWPASSLRHVADQVEQAIAQSGVASAGPPEWLEGRVPAFPLWIVTDEFVLGVALTSKKFRSQFDSDPRPLTAPTAWVRPGCSQESQLPDLPSTEDGALVGQVGIPASAMEERCTWSSRVRGVQISKDEARAEIRALLARDDASVAPTPPRWLLIEDRPDSCYVSIGDFVMVLGVDYRESARRPWRLKMIADRSQAPAGLTAADPMRVARMTFIAPSVAVHWTEVRGFPTKGHAARDLSRRLHHATLVADPPSWAVDSDVRADAWAVMDDAFAMAIRYASSEAPASRRRRKPLVAVRMVCRELADE